MKRGLVVFFIFVLAVPLASSISLRELIDRYIFSVSTSEMNLDNYTDYMIDKNGNGINDTLVIELTANSAGGNFIFVVNLFDKNRAITNETNLTLSSGINKINDLTLPTLNMYGSRCALYSHESKIYSPVIEETISVYDKTEYCSQQCVGCKFRILSDDLYPLLEEIEKLNQKYPNTRIPYLPCFYSKKLN